MEIHFVVGGGDGGGGGGNAIKSEKIPKISTGMEYFSQKGNSFHKTDYWLVLLFSTT